MATKTVYIGDKPLVANGKVVQVDAQSTGGTDLSLGITGATVGQMIKIATVDSTGVPTKYTTGSAVAVDSPAYAATTEAMTDISKVYIGSNGHLWAYTTTTTQAKTAENVFTTSGVSLNIRLKTNGVSTGEQNGMAISDYIPVNLTTDPFWLWFKGWNLNASDGWPLYTKVYYYDSTKACLGGYDMSIPPCSLNYINMIDDGSYKKFKLGYAETSSNDSSTEAKLRFYNNIKYIRFNMLVVTGSNSPSAATSSDLAGIEIYLNQDPNASSEVTTTAWTDTGLSYSNYVITDADKQSIAEMVLAQLDSPYVNSANILSMPTSGTIVYSGSDDETLADTEPIGEV